MKILITGDRGYIGSVLTQYLHNFGYEIFGIDTGFFQNNLLSEPFTKYKFYNKDIRKLESNDLNNFDIVIHLAAISNDPLGQLNEDITNKINRDATVRLAELSKKNKISRFIYFSSQSMYGISKVNEDLDEYNSDKNPLTAYARTKYEAEQIILKLADNEFNITCLRPSTVFGASPRLRSDIVYNNLLSSAYLKNQIVIKSDGSPIRPVIHVLDVCNAVLSVLKAPRKTINRRCYNIGVKNGNYTVREMAECIKKIIKNSSVYYSKEHGNDSRTYSVSFSRIFDELKDYYKPTRNLEKGALELLNFFKKTDYKEEDFIGTKTNRLNMLNYLLKNNKINEEFFWK